MGIAPVILEGLDFTVFGLPAHPLVVHAAVVLIPLSALAFVMTAWRRQWRDAYLLPIAGLAAVGAVAAFLASQTGEALEETVKETGKRLGEHPEQGDTAMIAAMIFGICAVATYVSAQFGPGLRRRLHMEHQLRLPVSDEIAAYIITVPVAIIASVLMLIAGHSGADLVWKTL